MWIHLLPSLLHYIPNQIGINLIGHLRQPHANSPQHQFTGVKHFMRHCADFLRTTRYTPQTYNGLTTYIMVKCSTSAGILHVANWVLSQLGQITVSHSLLHATQKNSIRLTNTKPNIVSVDVEGDYKIGAFSHVPTLSSPPQSAYR